MIRRPVGVVVSAIVLSLTAAILCLMACASALGAVMTRHMPVTVEAPGVSPTSGLLLGIVIFTVLFYLVLAAWAIITVVGLFRMRSWARISIMIIGGGLAAIGLFSALVSVAMPVMMKSRPLAPGADLATMRIVFFVIGALWLFVAAIGAGWLVYFALRSTREAFAQAKVQQGLPPAGTGMAAAYSSSSPITDFTVARPLLQEPIQPSFNEPPITLEPKAPRRDDQAAE